MTLQLKKLSNHWYLNINHPSNSNISLDPRLELYIDRILKIKSDIINLDFIDIGDIFVLNNTLLFNEEDITRFITTDDYFNLRFKLNHKEFIINSDLIFLLEKHFNFNFHKIIYNIEYGI